MINSTQSKKNETKLKKLEGQSAFDPNFCLVVIIWIGYFFNFYSLVVIFSFLKAHGQPRPRSSKDIGAKMNITLHRTVKY
jgi:hypothetical protein